MKTHKFHQPFVWLILAFIHGITNIWCLAGAPGPPITEAGLLASLQSIKACPDETMPGDNLPRRIRLAHTLYALAKFYNDKKTYEKADQYYAETLALISDDTSDWRPGNLRYYSHAMATDFLNRGDLVKAKEHLDRALKICREDSKQKEVLPSVLTTLAEWQRQKKQFKEAEATLLEAIGILGAYGSVQRKDLATIYLEANQLAKADQTITELEKSTYMSYAASSVMFLRAKWLRTSGKTAEADELDAKARAAEAKELEHQRNSQ